MYARQLSLFVTTALNRKHLIVCVLALSVFSHAQSDLTRTDAIWLEEGAALEAYDFDSAQWVWHAADGAEPAGTRYFRRSFTIPSDRGDITRALVLVTADDSFTLSINGSDMGSGGSWSDPHLLDVSSQLVLGANTLAISAVNGGGAAGLIARAQIEFSAGPVLNVITDGQWKSQDVESATWQENNFDDSSWPSVTALGANGIAPWGTVIYDRAVKDTYVAFRGSFSLAQSASVEIQFIGAHWFDLYLDDEFVTEGPVRFAANSPKYATFHTNLSAGTHLLSALVHNNSVDTRWLNGDKIPAFFAAIVKAEGQLLAVDWTGKQFNGYQVSGLKPNTYKCLSWIEWCDTRQNPVNWRRSTYDDSGWGEPVATDLTSILGPMEPLYTGQVKYFWHSPALIASNTVSGNFGEPEDWFTRLLDSGTPSGAYYRYDLGHVKLGAPEITIDLPAGTVVQVAYCETLSSNTFVSPLSPNGVYLLGTDLFIARGGEQTFRSLTPKGMRYFEFHIQGDPTGIPIPQVRFRERCYFDLEPAGSFVSGDARLDEIWALGIPTLRGCAEDAITDCPTRERGQWLGDVMTVGMGVATGIFNDLRLFKQALIQAANEPSPWTGIVAGQCPGTTQHLETYALQWTIGVLDYYRETGDSAFLQQLYDSSKVNLLHFHNCWINSVGLDSTKMGWPFVDVFWGGDFFSIRGEAEGTDHALNLHYYSALKAMEQWSLMLGELADKDYYRAEAEITGSTILSWLVPLAEADEWETIGFHCTALALCFELLPDDLTLRATEYLKTEVDAVHLSAYFTYYFTKALIENGGMDDAVGLYKKRYGEVLDKGHTTMPEHYDGGSFCHVWACTPTAHLTRYGLGLKPRYDLGQEHFELSLKSGSMPGASGNLPFANKDGVINVSWSRQADGIHYHLETPRTIYLHIDEQVHTINSTFDYVIKDRVIISADNAYEVFLNGSMIGSGNDWSKSGVHNLSLKPGKNVIAIKGIDAGGQAALLAEVICRGERIGTGSSWLVSTSAPSGWNDVLFDDSGWADATEYGAYGIDPWQKLVDGMPGDTEAQWIWSADWENHNEVYFRKTIYLPITTAFQAGPADLGISCDNAYELYLNGSLVGQGDDWSSLDVYSINLALGTNVLAVRCLDAGGIASAIAELSQGEVLLGTSSDWKVSNIWTPGWIATSFNDSSWGTATEHFAYGEGLWGTWVEGMPINTPAKWIWSEDSDGDNEIFLRKQIVISDTDDGLDPSDLAAYDAWGAANGLTAGVNDGLRDDAENGGIGDGVINLLEYALGGNPLVDDAADLRPQLFVAEEGGTNWIYYTQSRRKDDPTLSYAVFVTDDLVTPSNWVTNAPIDQSAEVDGFTTFTHRTVLDRAGFFKLRVQQGSVVEYKEYTTDADWSPPVSVSWTDLNGDGERSRNEVRTRSVASKARSEHQS